MDNPYKDKPYKDKPYVVELEDGEVIIFKNIEEFLNSEYNNNSWLWRTYANYYSEELREPLSEADEIVGQDPIDYIEGA